MLFWCFHLILLLTVWNLKKRVHHCSADETKLMKNSRCVKWWRDLKYYWKTNRNIIFPSCFLCYYLLFGVWLVLIYLAASSSSAAVSAPHDWKISSTCCISLLARWLTDWQLARPHYQNHKIFLLCDWVAEFSWIWYGGLTLSLSGPLPLQIHLCLDNVSWKLGTTYIKNRDNVAVI